MFCCFVDIIANKVTEDPQGNGKHIPVIGFGCLCEFSHADFCHTIENKQMTQVDIETTFLEII